MVGVNPRICIPIPHRRQGGLYTFLSNWRHWLDENGIFHTEDLESDYDVLFVNSWVIDAELIKPLKQRHKKLIVVQRVDGSATDYGRLDDADRRQAHVNMLADLTIFQSKYSKFATRNKHRVILADGPIIYNPVDLEMFRLDGARYDFGKGIKVCSASFSTGQMKGTWQIGDLARQNPDITFVLCGIYPELPDLPNIRLIGHLERAEIACAMRSCDVFLSLSENEACPNVVLEALASGLPVLYIDSGGTPELVGNVGSAVTIDTFQQKLGTIIAKQEELSLLARARAEEYFSSDQIFPQYLVAIQNTVRRPLPSRYQYIAAKRRGYPVEPTPIDLSFLPRLGVQTRLKSLLRKLRAKTNVN